MRRRLGTLTIRWQNVAKLAAGAIACAGVALALPGLLRRPEPPPLEPDVGLSSIRPAATPRVEDPPRRHQEDAARRRAHAHRPPRADRGDGRARRGRNHTMSDRDRAVRHPVATAVESSSAPPPSPSPVAASAPAPPPPPAPAPAPPSSPPATTAAQTPPPPPSDPAEFGFEH